ncbi:hypothetical protein VC83_08744 [Pseudogymnoascus destructans]|uniref:Uncharacterized protein n=2 Tax=Pseudogymnoascus destructans TaxID=655981 RepID=L8FZL4_PSED2|nr:uncharacterized protein VC83_08744 [Pseudogymnoascus destructans]ELR06455.1 hypothetical protein GMDG_07980 [Pseudogymnoascus destructans 20631-21]OAF55058.1 hypothetical protein VC83_08744 [Pseudogymnoascus destructans]
MSDTPSYQGKALGTRLLRGQGSWGLPSRRNRRADGVESFYSSSPRRPAKIDNAATTEAVSDNISVNDAANSHPLGDLSQHGQTFERPKFEITDKSPGHSLQRKSEELADPNPSLAGHPHQREESSLYDPKNVEKETSSVILARNPDQQSDEKFFYQPEASNPVDDVNSEGPDNLDRGETAAVGVKAVSSSRQYERPWPRTRRETGSHRFGYIPPSIAERISAHDEPVNPTNLNVLARLGLASSVSLPSSALVAEVEAGGTSSPSILSKSAEPSPFSSHFSQEAAHRNRQTLRRKPPIHREDLPARPAPAVLPHLPISVSQEVDHIARAARDIAMPAVAHVRNSPTDRELAFRRDVVAPHPGGDKLNTNHLQDRQLHPVGASYDGIASMHSYNTETPVEPSTLESIYEDASDEPISTTPREEKPVERGYQKITASSFVESARKGSEYLRGSPRPLEPSVASSDLQSSTAIKSIGREPEVRGSRKQHADKSQAISSSEAVATKAGTLEQPNMSKRGWPPYKRRLLAKSASSSIYSQPESHSLMSDIRAAFIRGEDDTHRYERLGYHQEDSNGTFDAIPSNQYVKDADQKGTAQLTQPPEPKSPLEPANIKQPTSQYTNIFARRSPRRAGAIDYTKIGSQQRARQRKVPSKSSQLQRFSRRFRTGRSNTSSKNTVSAEELLALKEATSEEYETNSTATDEQMSAISEKKTRGPKNWFEGILSFHKKGTDKSTTLFSKRKSDVKLNREVAMSGFIPYDKHASHSGSIRKRASEDTERLIMMIENLEKRLDEALYPAHKVHYADVAEVVPQQQITGRVEAHARRSPIRHTSRYIQPGGSEGYGAIKTSDLRSRFEKVSYGSDKNGAMRKYPLPLASNLRSSNVDNMSRRMPGALPVTSTAPFPTGVVTTLESPEPERSIVSYLLNDKVALTSPRDAGSEASIGVRKKPINADCYTPSGVKPLRKSPYKTTFAANMRKRATVVPRSRDRELSKERILRFVKEHNVPPIQPRRSSLIMRVPRRDDSQGSGGLPTSQYSTRALRVHTSMDGAHEADDEMESEIEYITPRRKPNRAIVRRHRISYEEAHHMQFLHGERENSGQIFEWPPHITTPARVRDDDEGSDGSNDTQRVYVTAGSRQHRGAGDISPADERLVTLAAGFSVAFIYLLLCVYIVFGPDNRYAMSI